MKTVKDLLEFMVSELSKLPQDMPVVQYTNDLEYYDKSGYIDYEFDFTLNVVKVVENPDKEETYAYGSPEYLPAAMSDKNALTVLEIRV